MYNSRIPDTNSWSQYFRLLKNDFLYVSQMYKTDLQTKSSVVLYIHNNNQTYFAEIQCFIKTMHRCCNEQICQCQQREKHYAIIQKIATDDVFIVRSNNNVADTSSFLQKCHKINNFIAIPIVSLICVCIYIEIDNNTYVSMPINEKEVE